MASTYRVALMARVSTLKQGDKPMSLPDQYKTCREYAASKGWEIVAEFEDKASGMKWDRPGLLAAIDLAKRGLIDGVLAINHDRLCRDTDVRGWFKIELAQHRVRIHYSTVPDEADTPYGRGSDGMQSVLAQFNRDTLMANTTKGKVARVHEGKILHNGDAPLGYCLNEDRTAYERNDDEVPWLVEIFERYANGESTTEIARWLNETPGAPEPRRNEDGIWNRSTITTILSREDYTGRGTRLDWEMPTDEHGRDLLKSSRKTGDGVVLEFPKLIEPALWQRVQRAKAEASHRSSMKRADTDPNVGLLRGSGRVVCVGCGQPMAYEKERVTKGRVQPARYRCRHRRPCPNRGSFQMAELDEMVWDTVRDIVMDPSLLEERHAVGIADGSMDREVEMATQAVAALDKEMRGLRLRLRKEAGDDVMYEELAASIREVQGQLLEARDREASLLRQRAQAKADAERLHEFGMWLTRHQEQFETLEMSGRRRLVGLVGIEARVKRLSYGRHAAQVVGSIAFDMTWWGLGEGTEGAIQDGMLNMGPSACAGCASP